MIIFLPIPLPYLVLPSYAHLSSFDGRKMTDKQIDKFFRFGKYSPYHKSYEKIKDLCRENKMDELKAFLGGGNK
jgi:hypothetical protein